MNITSQRLSEQAVRGLVHPHTGEPLSPLGFRKDGSPIFPIMGASPDDESDDADKDDEDDASGDEDASGDDDDPEDDESGEQSDVEKAANEALKAKNRELAEEKRKQRKRAVEAEADRDDLRRRLQAIEDKDKPETERLARENETLVAENSTLKEKLQSERLSNAFLTDNTHTWHNPGHAMTLMDLSDVEIDDDGKVHGLKDAIAKTAKDHPYLLKSEEVVDPSKDKKPPKKSGLKPKDDDKKQLSDAEKKAALEEKYPGLRR